MTNSIERNEMPTDFAGLRPCRLILATLGVLGVMWCPSPASAGGWPVFDGLSYTQLLAQYAEIVKQVDAAYQQIVLLQIQVNAVTGHHTYNQLIAPIDGGSVRSWDDIAAMVSRGMNPASATDQQIFQSAQNYLRQNPTVPVTYQPTDPDAKQMFNVAINASVNGSAVANASFMQINQDMADIHTLTERIGTTDDLKSALDLNTTVNAKLAVLSAELLRVEAAQLAVQSADHTGADGAYKMQAQFLAN